MSRQINSQANVMSLFHGAQAKGPVLITHEFDKELQAHVEVMEFAVSNKARVPDDLPAGLTAEIINPGTINNARLRARWAPVDALNAYVVSFPTRVRMDIPRVLQGVHIVWNSQYSIGTQETSAYNYASGTSGSIGLNIPDSASASASLTAEVQVSWVDYAENDLFGTQYEFFMQGPITQATVLAKLTDLAGAAVSMWPVFKPKSETITVVGQSIAVRANVQVSLQHSWSPGASSIENSKSTSDDFSIGVSNNSVQIPACIHGAITFTGDTSRSQAISATAFMALASTMGASVTASKTKSGTAYGSVYPTSLSATSGTNTIPTTGLYLVDVLPTAYDYGWFKVKAQVFDAANFA